MKRTRGVKRIPRPAEQGKATIRTADGKRYDVYFSCVGCQRVAIWSMPGGKCPRCGSRSFWIWGLEEMSEAKAETEPNTGIHGITIGDYS